MQHYPARSITVLLMLWLVAHAAQADILPEPKKISEHVYAWIGPFGSPNEKNRGFRMNLVFVVGKDAIAVIDSGHTEAIAKEMVKHIATISSKPIKYVINSSSQPHRYFGNEVFRHKGATIITSTAEAKRMAEMGDMFVMAAESAMKLKPGSVSAPGAPTRTIDKNETLELGGVTLKLSMHDAAHTPNPVVVEIVQDKVVYAGDILYSGRLLAVIEGGNVGSWIKAFDSLRQYGEVTFIPGHGQPAKLAAFEFSTRAYLVLLHTHMKKMVAEGVDMVDAINKLDQGKFSKLENFEELARRNASFAYREAESESF